MTMMSQEFIFKGFIPNIRTIHDEIVSSLNGPVVGQKEMIASPVPAPSLCFVNKVCWQTSKLHAHHAKNRKNQHI